MKKIENDQNGNPRLQFEGTLQSISDKVLQNVNSKNYRVATVEFVNTRNEVKKASGFVFEGNYNHPDCIAAGGMIPGEKYLCTATMLTNADGTPSVIVQVSHLQGFADRPEINDFDFAMETVEQGDFQAS